MSSESISAQAEIKRLNPKAAYTHCCGHNLALVISDACKVPVVSNCLATAKECSKFFVKVSFYITLLK